MPVDWDALANTVHERPPRDAADILQERAPRLHEDLVATREHPWPLAHWGESFNFDENVRQRIVSTTALRTIGQLAGHRLPVRRCHSGLLHTFGYLFSTIETPYGKKRDRWVRPTIESGFGIKPQCLRPEPRRGTLLHNVTWFVGRIAFRDDGRILGRLGTERVAPTILDYDYDHLETTRLTERVRLADRSQVELHTELVAFPKRRTAKADAFLIYWTKSRAAGKRLLTCFTIGRATAAALLESATGGHDDISARYNAAIDGLEEPRRGRRFVAET